MRETERTKEPERNITEGAVGKDTFCCINSSNIHVRCKIIETKNSNLFPHSECCLFIFFPSFSPGCRLHIITSDISKTQPELTKRDRLKLNNSCREITIFYCTLIFDKISP